MLHGSVGCARSAAQSSPAGKDHLIEGRQAGRQSDYNSLLYLIL